MRTHTMSIGVDGRTACWRLHAAGVGAMLSPDMKVAPVPIYPTGPACGYSAESPVLLLKIRVWPSLMRVIACHRAALGRVGRGPK